MIKSFEFLQLGIFMLFLYKVTSGIIFRQRECILERKPFSDSLARNFWTNNNFVWTSMQKQFMYRIHYHKALSVPTARNQG